MPRLRELMKFHLPPPRIRGALYISEYTRGYGRVDGKFIPIGFDVTLRMSKGGTSRIFVYDDELQNYF